MKLVYIVGGGQAYAQLFRGINFEVTLSLESADLVCFTGGEDVTPELYGDKAHEYTYNSVHRDAKEQEVFKRCTDAGTPMVGICRGGQFLNVMSGGRMYQHVSNHACADGHDMVDLETGEHIYVSSTHHQMFMPGTEAEVVAVANLGGTREWFDGQVAQRDVSNTDYEVLYYPATNSLCFQPHPEFYSVRNQAYLGMRDYFTRLVEAKLGVTA